MYIFCQSNNLLLKSSCVVIRPHTVVSISLSKGFEDIVSRILKFLKDVTLQLNFFLYITETCNCTLSSIFLERRVSHISATALADNVLIGNKPNCKALNNNLCNKLKNHQINLCLVVGILDCF